MNTFWLRQLRLGPIHLSLVRNDMLTRTLERRIGGFLTWDRRWMASTLRVGPIYLNVDIDVR